MCICGSLRQWKRCQVLFTFGSWSILLIAFYSVKSSFHCWSQPKLLPTVTTLFALHQQNKRVLESLLSTTVPKTYRRRTVRIGVACGFRWFGHDDRPRSVLLNTVGGRRTGPRSVGKHGELCRDVPPCRLKQVSAFCSNPCNFFFLPCY